MLRVSMNKKSALNIIMPGIIIVTAVFIYTLVFIYPSHRDLSRTRKVIFEKTAELERRNLLFPVFAKSKTLSRVQFEQKLPFPERKQVNSSELPKLSRQILNIASQNNMTLFNSNFDINSLKKPSEFVSITIELKGKLSDFRSFLIDIIALEFFDSIRSLSIISDQYREKIFSLRLDIKTKKKFQ